MSDVTRVSIVTPQTGPNAPGATDQLPSSKPPAPNDNPAPAEQSKSDRPAWLPEKFKSPEDLAKAYSELEKKQGKSGGKQDAKPAEGEPPTDDAAKEAVQSAGLDFEGLQNKYYEKGTLEESDYEALQKAGIPKSMVDNYIAGVEAQAMNFTKTVVDTVGGPDNYSQMTAWAKDNMQEHEIKTFNEAVNSGDFNRAMTAVKALKTDFQSARGFDPKLTSGRQSAPASETYDNWKQVSADMGKPEYKRDPAFRKAVEAKMARSNLR